MDVEVELQIGFSHVSNFLFTSEQDKLGVGKFSRTFLCLVQLNSCKSLISCFSNILIELKKSGSSI